MRDVRPAGTMVASRPTTTIEEPHDRADRRPAPGYFSLFSALGRIRTSNLLIRSQIGLNAVLTREMAGQPEAKWRESDALTRPR